MIDRMLSRPARPPDPARVGYGCYEDTVATLGKKALTPGPYILGAQFQCRRCLHRLADRVLG